MLAAILAMFITQRDYQSLNDSHNKQIWDLSTGVLLKQTTPSFAFVKRWTATKSGKWTTYSIEMMAARPASVRDPEVIEFWWFKPNLERPADAVLFVLEGGRTPHPKLKGALSRNRAPLIIAPMWPQTPTITDSCSVTRNGAKVIVRVPSAKLKGYVPRFIIVKWLPANAEEPFASNGVLMYAANVTIIGKMEGSGSLPTSAFTLDRLVRRSARPRK